MGSETSVVDTAGVNAWSKIVTDRTDAGQIARQIFYYDDGRSLVRDTDTDGTHPWATLETGYDAANRLDYVTSVQANGLRSVHDYDQTGQQGWSRIDDEYDASGRAVSDTINYRNGEVGRTVYDNDNSKPYAYWQQTLDAQGRQEDITVHMDDGTATKYVYDVANTQAYAYTIARYDASGARSSLETHNDDGSYSIVSGGDAYGAGSTTYTYDASNRLTSKSGISADLVYYGIGKYDVDNSQPWSSISENYQNGLLRNTQITYDDGHVETYGFSYRAAVTQDIYGSSGRIVESIHAAPQYASTQVTLYAEDKRIVYSSPLSVDNLELGYSGKFIEYHAARFKTEEYNYFNQLLFTDPANASKSHNILQTTTISQSLNYITSRDEYLFYADGTRREYYADNSNGESYTVSSAPYYKFDYYDQLNRITKSDVTYHDNHFTTQFNRYDIDSDDAWTVLVNTYDTGYDHSYNIVDSYRKTYIDRTSSYVQFDQHNAYDWTSITNRYNAEGNLTDTTTVLDSGTSRKIVYDVDNQSEIASTTYLYDAHHVLTGTHLVYDDGHVVDLAG